MTGSAHDPGHEPSAFHAPNGGSRERARRSEGSLARTGPESTDNAALIQDAQSLLEAFAGRDAAVLLASVTELCRLLASRGSARRAEVLLRQIVPIGEQHLDRDHVALGHVLHELAHIYLREGRHAEAEPLLRRLYYMQCRRCGKDHPDAAAVLASIARVRQALGQHDEAEAMWRQVIAVCEQTLGSQHVATTTAVERLAESCAARGKMREAVQLRAQASAMRDAWVMQALPAPIGAPLPAPTTRIVATHAVEPEAPVPDLVEVPGVSRPSLIVLPSSSGALTMAQQHGPEATQEALRAIHAELEADGGGASGGRGRRWPVLAAAAAVLALLGGLTASGAASTFGARPTDGAPTWAAGSGIASPPHPDSANSHSVYEVRLAAETAPAPDTVVVAPVTAHARLIGPVPQLPLPEALIDRRVNKDVAVRFRVDARGVPDSASLVVVHSPDDLLSDVVRRAVGDLRFTPARRAGGAVADGDVVEMTFGFSRIVP